VLKNKEFTLLIVALSAIFLFSACGSSGYAKRPEAGHLIDLEKFNQSANETIKKYARGQCNLFVQDVLRQYNIDLPGSADQMILYMKRSLNWKRISMDEANEIAGRAQIVVAAQRPPRPDTPAHVCFVLYDRGYRNGGFLTVIGTYQCRESSLNYEFDLDKPPPVEFYYYRKH